MNLFKYKNKKNEDYFEGWYLRLVDENNNVNLALIFAITKDLNEPHSFIQVYDGITLKNKYYRFSISDFQSSEDTISIKDNKLSLSGLYLKLDDLEISININNIKKIGKNKWNNSAMSYMSNFPLECFQEVNIIDGSYSGIIIRNSELTNISGKPYMEKTYGNKFPVNWIWIQSNHLSEDASFTFAYGLIPLFKWKVRGFFSILEFNGSEYRFASYNLARIKINKKSNNEVEIILKKGFKKLIINANMINPVKLIGPAENGEMILEVFESINSVLNIKLYKGKKLVFNANGRNVGFELNI